MQESKLKRWCVTAMVHGPARASDGLSQVHIMFVSVDISTPHFLNPFLSPLFMQLFRTALSSSEITTSWR